MLPPHGKEVGRTETPDANNYNNGFWVKRHFIWWTMQFTLDPWIIRSTCTPMAVASYHDRASLEKTTNIVAILRQAHQPPPDMHRHSSEGLKCFAKGHNRLAMSRIGTANLSHRHGFSPGTPWLLFQDGWLRMNQVSFLGLWETY